MAIHQWIPRTEPLVPIPAARIPIGAPEEASPSPLFRLPPEIRLQIYFYVFLSYTPHARPAPCPLDRTFIQPCPETILLGFHRPRLPATIEDFPRLDRLAPLLISRQFYHEALAILYGDFAFHFPENLWHQDVGRWLDPVPSSSRRMIKRVGVAVSIYADEEGDETYAGGQRGSGFMNNAWRDANNKAYKLLRGRLPELESVHLSIIDESNDGCILGTFQYLRDILISAIRVFKGVPEVRVGRCALKNERPARHKGIGDMVWSARHALKDEGGGTWISD